MVDFKTKIILVRGSLFSQFSFFFLFFLFTVVFLLATLDPCTFDACFGGNNWFQRGEGMMYLPFGPRESLKYLYILISAPEQTKQARPHFSLKAAGLPSIWRCFPGQPVGGSPPPHLIKNIYVFAISLSIHISHKSTTSCGGKKQKKSKKTLTLDARSGGSLFSVMCRHPADGARGRRTDFHRTKSTLHINSSLILHGVVNVLPY